MIFQRKIKKIAVASAAVFFGFFLTAVGFYIADGYTKNKHLIFFPEPARHNVTGETRIIHRQSSMEDDVLLLVKEIVLGPMDIRHTGVLPKNTKVRSVMVRDRTAYLDFSFDVLFLAEEVNMSFDESLSAVRKTILFNFRKLEDVIITIDGQIPGVPSFLAYERKRKPGDENQGKNR